MESSSSFASCHLVSQRVAPDTKGTPSTKHYRMMKATAVVDHITEAFEKLTGAHDAHGRRTEDMYISYSAQTVRQHCVPFLERESQAVGAHLRQH